MTYTWNFRITFKMPDSPTPDVTVQNASDIDGAMSQARRHVIGYGPVEVLKKEIKHHWGWETL